MPTVGKKKFSYSAKGRKDAKAYAAKSGKKMIKTKRKAGMGKKKGY